MAAAREQRTSHRAEHINICQYVDTMKRHGELLHIEEAEGLRLRGKRPGHEQAARTAARLRALGDPTRLTLALALRDGRELCVCDLSWIAERAQNLVSHHMRILHAERLVRSARAR